MTPTTEAGRRLLAWAQSDMRPLPEFGWDEIAEAIVDIEREAAARQDEPSPALRGRRFTADELLGDDNIFTEPGVPEYRPDWTADEIAHMVRGRRETERRCSICKAWEDEHHIGSPDHSFTPDNRPPEPPRSHHDFGCAYAAGGPCTCGFAADEARTGR